MAPSAAHRPATDDTSTVPPDAAPRFDFDLCVRRIAGIRTQQQDPFEIGLGRQEAAALAFVVHRESGIIASACVGVPAGAGRHEDARRQAVHRALANVRFRGWTRLSVVAGELGVRANPATLPADVEERPGMIRLDDGYPSFDTDLFGFGKGVIYKAENAKGYLACNALARELADLALPGGWDEEDERPGAFDSHTTMFVPLSDIPVEERSPTADEEWLQTKLDELVEAYNVSLIGRDPEYRCFLPVKPGTDRFDG